MGHERVMLSIAEGNVALLRKLVGAELDRGIAAIDEIVAAGYGQYIGKRAEGNREAVRLGVLALVKSPLATLERQLGEAEQAAKTEAGAKAEAVPAAAAAAA